MPIRPAIPADASAIVAILGHAIRTSVAHFGDIAPSEAAVQRDIAQHDTHPFLVWEDGGQVLGFANLRPWKARAAYRWAAEIGIYLAPSAQGKGVGGRLVDALIVQGRSAGLRTLVAGMTLPNPSSQRLFEGRGFTAAGVFPQIGHKHGRWHDVGYWTRRLAPPEPDAPA